MEKPMINSSVTTVVITEVMLYITTKPSSAWFAMMKHDNSQKGKT
jgi:hypothetical protein